MVYKMVALEFIFELYGTILYNAKLLYTNPIVKHIVDSISDFHSHSRYYVHKYLLNSTIEPFGDWVNASYVTDARYDNSLLFEETYSEFTEYKDLVENYDPDDAMDSIIVIKYSDMFTSQYAVTHPQRVVTIPAELSTAYFLSIVYTHPLMNNVIYLNIDRTMFVVGNELLSPAFVLRSLHYQYPIHFLDETLYCFDKDYIIKIIDHNVKFFEITSNQYIKITKDGYDVVDKESKESDSDESKKSEELNFVVL